MYSFSSSLSVKIWGKTSEHGGGEEMANSERLLRQVPKMSFVSITEVEYVDYHTLSVANDNGGSF